MTAELADLEEALVPGHQAIGIGGKDGSEHRQVGGVATRVRADGRRNDTGDSRTKPIGDCSRLVFAEAELVL